MRPERTKEGLIGYWGDIVWGTSQEGRFIIKCDSGEDAGLCDVLVRFFPSQ